MFVGAATLIADMSPRDRRAEGASYFSVAVFGGIGMGPIIGEALLDDTNFARAFVVAGLFAFLAAGLALFAPARVDTDDDGRRHASHRRQPATGRRRLIHPAAIMPGLVLACGVAAFSAFGAFVPDYSRSVGMASSGALFAVYALVSVLVRLFGATLPERLGPRRAVTIALSNVLIGLADSRRLPDDSCAVDRGGVRRLRDGVQLSVAARAHRQSGQRQRPGVGRQFVHDVLRGRFGRRRSVDRRVRPGRRQAARVPRRRRVLPARALPVAIPARSRRLAGGRPVPRGPLRSRTCPSPATDGSARRCARRRPTCPISARRTSVDRA